MAINVLHYRQHDHARWGVVDKGAITPIPGE